eukprot:m.159277 g.159277  ORF g.159277 m.159277 type:complete len:124 (-) comp14526_c0_seq7:314-685(-)
MDHTASVGHNRFVKLMISVTAIVMAFVLLLEWMDLPDRLLGGGSFTLGAEDSEFLERVQEDGNPLASPGTLVDRVHKLQQAVDRSKATLRNLEDSYDKLEPIADVKRRVQHINRMLLRQADEQ